MKIRNPPGAQFEILVDGKPRSYRDIQSRSNQVRGIPQEQTPAQCRRGQGTHEWRSNGRRLQSRLTHSDAVTRSLGTASGAGSGDGS